MGQLLKIATQASRENEIIRIKKAEDELRKIVEELPEKIKRVAEQGDKKLAILSFRGNKSWLSNQFVDVDPIQEERLIKPLILFLKDEGFKIQLSHSYSFWYLNISWE